MSTRINRTTSIDLTRGLAILSLDAGGPQAVSQLQILADVMKKYSQDNTGQHGGRLLRPCEVFDVIGGVGTGGFIAILLVVLKLNATEALEEFTKFVTEVFTGDPKKKTDKLKRALQVILEKHKIDEGVEIIPTSEPTPACKLIVPIMYNKHVGVPCVLRNYVSRESPMNLTVAEAMLATCATPPIFAPASISKDFGTFEYISGAIGCSNPIREIIAEAPFGKETAVACLLSIGCGHSGVNAAPYDTNAATWIEFLERVAMHSEKTARDIQIQMSELSLYHRFSVTYGLETGVSRAWSDLDITATHTATYLQDLEVAEAVARCVDTIKTRDGITTLERLRHSGGAKVLPPPLPSPTSNYVERKVPMEFLEKALFEEEGRIKSGSKRVVVTGIGGCGKTHLIRKFAEKYQNHFVSTLFIDGSSEDILQREMVRYVRSLSAANSQLSFIESMAVLSQHFPGVERLLIVDNVDNPDLDLSRFLPRWSNGTAIVTSRSHSRGQLNPASHLQLDVMSLDESVELLVRSSGQHPSSGSDEQYIKLAAQELGFLPLALAQAASYMFNTGISAKDYVSRLRSDRQRLLENPATTQVDMRYTTVDAALDASYGILPSNEQNVLHLLSLFYRQNFPLQLIIFAAESSFSIGRCEYTERGEDDGKLFLLEIFCSSGQWDLVKLDSIIVTLRNQSLITVVSTEKTRLLDMHPLVNEWARSRIPVKNFKRFQAAAARLLCCATESKYSIIRYLPSHVQAISSISEDVHANDVASFGFILEESGIYTGAAEMMGRAHKMVEAQLGAEHPQTMKAAASLGGIYRQLGRFADAEKFETKVLKQRELLLGRDHLDTILAAEMLAVTLSRLGRYAEAAVLRAETLRRRNHLLGPDHSDTIMASAGLAVSYTELGRHTDAEELKVDVLQKRQRLMGSDHPDTIMASANLAVTHSQLGRHTKAENLKSVVLTQRQKTLGPDHPHTLMISASLAHTYSQLGRYADAEALREEVLRRSQKLLGPDHPDTISASGRLAASYRKLGRYADAERLEIKVLEQREKLLGMNHPYAIWARASLAATYWKLERYTEAKELQTAVLRLLTEQLGLNHPITISASANLAATYRQLRQLDRAVELETKVLAQRTGLFGVEHPETIAASANLSITYHHQGRFVEAETLQIEALRLRTTILGERHPRTVRSMLSLAHTYKASQRDPEASALAQQASEIALEILGGNHPIYEEAAQLLASIPAPRLRWGHRFAAYIRRITS